MYDSEYDEVKNILENNAVTDLDQIEYGSEVYEDLYNYYANSGEMPYGVMKASAAPSPAGPRSARPSQLQPGRQ